MLSLKIVQQESLRTLSNFSNGGSHDWGVVVRVSKLQTHATPYEIHLEQRTAPTRTGDGNYDGSGTIPWMTTDQELALAQNFCGIAAVRGLNLKDRVPREVVQKHSALDFRPNDSLALPVSQPAGAAPSCMHVFHRPFCALERV
jgi:hypothetical protein